MNALFARVLFFLTMDLCGENFSQIDSHATASLRFLPAAAKDFFSLSLSLSSAACVTRSVMLRNSFHAGSPFPFRAAFFIFLFFLSSEWFLPPGSPSLVCVDARRSFVDGGGGSSNGENHHHYEYREHAFVGYTEKTKKTKKKCTDVVQMCDSWAEKGECEKNREYMFENCCCGAS